MPPGRVRSTAAPRVLLVLASGLLQRFCRYLAAAVACSRERPVAALCSYLAAPVARLASGLLQSFSGILRRLWLVSRAAYCSALPVPCGGSCLFSRAACSGPYLVACGARSMSRERS